MRRRKNPLRYPQRTHSKSNATFQFKPISCIRASRRWAERLGLLFPFPYLAMQALDQKVTKRSQTLDRDAVYSHHSRLSRLPTYLTIHMVRFAWRADISKKAKIMVRQL